MKTNHKIIIGDSRQMNLVPNESIHLIITSPPYWQLKDYGSDDQLGYHDTYEEYVNYLNLVWNECYRVLLPGCRLCINIGDQFARSVYYGRYKVIPIRTEIIKFCETIGFDYMGAVIWQKVTTMNTTGGATVMGSFPYPRNGIIKIDYEFILIFKKLGEAPKPTKTQKQLSVMTKEEWNTFFSGHWNFAGVKQNGHLAMYPEELPARLIKMFSFVGETILDPFLGSGTTSLAARNLNRNSVGYEINPEFTSKIQDKLGVDQQNSAESEYIFLQDNQKFNLYNKISELPYVFVDPLKLDKKVDPKKIQFGSKIDKDSTKPIDYFSVKEVISPSLIRLDNDLIIRLLGIKENNLRSKDAIEYLKKNFSGQKVFLRFDNQKYDENNNLLCYLYLKNKTFINAYLLKEGLTDVDTSLEYRFKNRFLEYGELKNG
ncbi:MAG: DNA methyltransferase [Anaerolineaceae bacterium]